MITKIELTNFKSHAHTVIEPGRVTALVGPNGCGKSAVLQSLYCLSRIVSKPPIQILKGELSLDILVRGYRNDLSIDLATYNDKLEIQFFTDNQYGHTRTWRLRGKWQLKEKPFDIGERTLENLGKLSEHIPSEITLNLGAIEYFKPSPSKLSQPTSIEDYPPKLNSDGSGLSSVIANLILSEPERLQSIENALREIVPTINKIKARHKRLAKAEKSFYIDKGRIQEATHLSSKTGYEMIFDTRSADAVPAHSMSEGTLLILGMLTLLQSPNPPKVFLLEDVEQGLHPFAQRQVMQVLKDFAEKHDRQIILTSHSPYIIDELPAEDIWVMATDKDGISHTKRLSDHPDAKRALDVLTTGELWDAEGESWVSDNAPAELVNA
jgi:predicted ATPase